MAAIDDLIAQIEDVTLRDRLREELKRLTRETKFGLVFEEHLPELTPVYSATIRQGSLVARRNGPLTETWRVLTIDGETAHCYKAASGEQAEIALADLVVVRSFGEPIFPALTPIDRVQNGPDDAPWHTLIEADNYHALQLLEYLYAGKVDCIYIDPPYNTGARDWKYNNDYIDSNDRWRHSKWLAMMKRRLSIAMKLLKHDGIMIVTVDDYEMHHLKSLLEQTQLQAEILGVVAIKNNPAGRATVRGFAVAHEYAIFVAKSPSASIKRLERTDEQIARYKEEDEKGKFEWGNFRKHGGTTTYRTERPKQYYPIYVNEDVIRIPNMKWDNKNKSWIILDDPTDEEEVLWPIDSLGNERVWSWGHETTRKEIKELIVKPDQQGKTAIYRKWRLNEEGSLPLSWWDKNIYSSAEHGTNLLKRIFGETQRFTFPKSVYAVRDCLRVAGLDQKDSLVLDFFAGSGTTLHATNLLNAFDGGNRRCILVTNNEVSEPEGKKLAEHNHLPGDAEWEQFGICRSVTWPRSKFTILGKQENGANIVGEYFTGKKYIKEKSRVFHRLSFVDPETLNNVARKKEIVGFVEDIPISHIKADSAFYIPKDENNTVAILFDDTQVEAFLDALEDAQHITVFYIVTRKNKLFQELKTKINELLRPIEVQEEEKRPMQVGFPANLEYFKLDFLEKDQVALGQQFRAILPILWLRAGAIGPRPELPANKPLPSMLLPELNPFAVLLDETCFADFQAALARRNDMSYVFLVTDSEEAFQEMARQINAPNAIQLYRDYLENFAINRGDNS